MSEIKAGDKNKGAAYIVANIAEYGCEWGSGQISGRPNGAGTELRQLRKDAPRIVVPSELVATFVATWGTALVAKAINGTSIDVSCERVCREALLANATISNDELKVKLVTSILLGVIVRGTVVTTKYVVGGRVFTSQADADKHVESTERGKQVEAASNLLAMLAENGVPAEVARNMAKTQYPLAFTEVIDDENTDNA